MSREIADVGGIGAIVLFALRELRQRFRQRENGSSPNQVELLLAQVEGIVRSERDAGVREIKESFERELGTQSKTLDTIAGNTGEMKDALLRFLAREEGRRES